MVEPSHHNRTELVMDESELRCSRVVRWEGRVWEEKYIELGA